MWLFILFTMLSRASDASSVSDAGPSWSPVLGPPTGARLTHVAIDRQTGRWVVTTATGHRFASLDGGVTWRRRRGHDPEAEVRDRIRDRLDDLAEETDPAAIDEARAAIVDDVQGELEHGPWSRARARRVPPGAPSDTLAVAHGPGVTLVLTPRGLFRSDQPGRAQGPAPWAACESRNEVPPARWSSPRQSLPELSLVLERHRRRDAAGQASSASALDAARSTFEVGFTWTPRRRRDPSEILVSGAVLLDGSGGPGAQRRLARRNLRRQRAVRGHAALLVDRRDRLARRPVAPSPLAEALRQLDLAEVEAQLLALGCSAGSAP